MGFGQLPSSNERVRLPIEIPGKKFSFSYGLAVGLDNSDIYLAANGEA